MDRVRIDFGESRGHSRVPGGWVIITLLITLTFSGCNPADTIAERHTGRDTPPVVLLPEFTAEESARIAQLRDAGGLKAATTFWPGIITESGNGTYAGFHYHLLREIGRILDVPVVIIGKEFQEFFTRDGEVPADVRTDPSVTYDPDVFNEADLIAYDISVLPWREKLMDFIPILPVRMLLLSSGSDPLVQLGDLQGRRGVVFENTSHETYLHVLNENLHLGIEIVSVPHGTDRFEIIGEGDADFMVQDATGVFETVPDNQGIEVTMPLGPALENAWAVRKGDDVLGSVLKKVLGYLQDSGAMDEGFIQSYGMTIRNYFGLISYNPESRLELTETETDYLEEIRQRGGLRAAIDEEQSIYEVDGDGRPFGLHYNLALAAAELLEIPIEFEVVNFREFFMKDGVVDDRLKDDPDFVYTPDLLDRVDFYVATMSPLPWRRKFLNFVELYPTIITYMVRKDGPVPDPADLTGWTFTILKDTSYEGWMNDHLDTSQFDIVYSETGLDQARLVSEGIADITVSDANLAITRFRTYPNLTIIPAGTEVDLLSWATDRNNPVLTGILEKVVTYLKADSTFETVWSAYYGTSFNEYLALISAETTPSE